MEKYEFDYEEMARQSQMIKDLKKSKKQKVRKKKIQKLKDDVKNNFVPVLKTVCAGAIALSPILIPLVGLAVQAKRNSRLRKKQNFDMKVEKEKEYKIYDRSLGAYLDLNKKLSKSDLKTIDQRKQSGERLINILDDLGILK